GADDGVNLRSPCRRHRSRGYAGADERRVIGLKAAAHQHIGRHEMGAGAGRGDADRQSFQALWPAVGDGFRAIVPRTNPGYGPYCVTATTAWPLDCIWMVWSKVPTPTSALPPTSDCRARAPLCTSLISIARPASRK